MVLSPCLYLSSLSFSFCALFDIITSSLSSFQVFIFLWGKLYLFVSFRQIPFYDFFLCLLKYLAFPILNIRPFLSVSSRLLINLYSVIKSPLSFLSSSFFFFLVCVCLDPVELVGLLDGGLAGWPPSVSSAG